MRYGKDCNLVLVEKEYTVDMDGCGLKNIRFVGLRVGWEGVDDDSDCGTDDEREMRGTNSHHSPDDSLETDCGLRVESVPARSD